MCTLFLVRPGQTDFDDQHRIQGSLDLPLNESGVQEVDTLIPSLKNRDLELILCGPREPAFSTALRISQQLDVPHKATDLLQNLHQGIWEGLELGEVKRKFPKVYKHWEDAPSEVAVPNAEPIEKAIKRIDKLLKKYLRKEKRLLIVAGEPLATLITCYVEGRKVCLDHYGERQGRCELQELQPTR